MMVLGNERIICLQPSISLRSNNLQEDKFPFPGHQGRRNIPREIQQHAFREAGMESPGKSFPISILKYLSNNLFNA
ncbi:MAG: hypothetical protein ACFFD1_08945 [Candidatus Thorarchaeota archaeon]